MNVLAEHEGKIYATITIADLQDPVSLRSRPPFPCLIWDHEGRSTATERSAVARTLLQSGCRYAVCGGRNSEDWHDAMDDEVVQRILDAQAHQREAAHVMTTQHDGEDPDDVAFFFVLATNFDEHDFHRYLVLHVGLGPAKDEVDAAVRKYALSPPD